MRIRVARNLLLIALMVMAMMGYAEAANFARAKPIKAGTYKKTKLKKGFSEIYKLKVEPSSRLTIHVEYLGRAKTPEGYLHVYNGKKRHLSSHSSETELDFSYLTGGKRVETLFLNLVGFKITSDSTSTGYSLAIATKKVADAGANRDAGDTFAEASPIEIGKAYPNSSLSGDDRDDGTDAKDFFRLNLKKHDQITAAVTPAASVEMTAELFTEDRQSISRVQAQNEGEIIKASWIAGKDQLVYLAIGSRQATDYGLEISRKEFKDFALLEKNPYLKLQFDKSGIDPNLLETFAAVDAANPDDDRSAKAASPETDADDQTSAESAEQPGAGGEVRGVGISLIGGLLRWVFRLLFWVGIIGFVLAAIEIVRANQSRNWKIIWLAVCFIGGLIGCAIYYFFGRKGLQKRPRAETNARPRVSSADQTLEHGGSSDPKSIEGYIEQARESGLSDEQIRSELINAGWPREKVDTYL